VTNACAVPVWRVRFKPEVREKSINMRIIDLFDGDVVESDNKETGAIEGFNGRQSFIIRKQNTRVDSPIIREP